MIILHGYINERESLVWNHTHLWLVTTLIHGHAIQNIMNQLEKSRPWSQIQCRCDSLPGSPSHLFVYNSRAYVKLRGSD